jgi:hypothetical protein
VNERKLIGYTERDEGFYPMYEPPRGVIVTHAFILCKYCNGAVYHCMGPRYDAVCLTCYEKEPDERLVMRKNQMNERIKELEAQCWEPKQYGPPWFNSQKFAELIVEECLMKAIGAKIRGESIDTLIQNIKEDFGVKE